MTTDQQRPDLPVGRVHDVFVYRMIPPRASFAVDQTDGERAIMAEHVAYWTRRAARGEVLVFGPVPEPDGLWGLAVVRCADTDAVHELARNDPAVSSGLATYTVTAMPVAVVPEP